MGQGSPGCATTGPPFGLLTGDGYATARSESTSDEGEATARAAVTGAASPRTSAMTATPAAIHGVSEPRRLFLVLAFIDVSIPSARPATVGRDYPALRPDYAD